jgi:hypothetical protein
LKERHRYLRPKGASRRGQRIGLLLHVPSGFGKGKWQSLRGLIRYKLARRKRNLIAKASRRLNRLQRAH